MRPQEEYRVGDQAVRLTAKQKAAVKQRTVDVRANYCERTLSITFGVDRNENVAFVKKKAVENLTQQLSKHFPNVPFLELDLELTDVFPDSTSDKQQIGALGKDVVFTFWPVDHQDKDSQQASNDYPIATEFLANRQQHPVHGAAKSEGNADGMKQIEKQAEKQESTKSSTADLQSHAALYSLARRSLLLDAREKAARLAQHEDWKTLLNAYPRPESLRNALCDALRGEIVLGRCLADDGDVIELLTSDLDAARIVQDADHVSRASMRFIFAWMYNQGAAGSPW